MRAFSYPTFRRLYGAQVVSLLGTGLLTVALGLLAYDLVGPDAGRVLGTALAVKMVAYVVMAPVMRALVTALPASRVLVGADVVRVAIACCLPWVGHVWQIYLLVFALQTASATFTPTFSATVARVVDDRDDYSSAVAASRIAYDLESVGSPLIAAALLTVVSYSTLFVGTALGFAASAVLVISCRRSIKERPTSTAESFARRTLAGCRIMLARGSFRGVLWINVVVAAATALVMVGTVVFVRADLGGSATAVAVALAVFGAGSIAAALLGPTIFRCAGTSRPMLACALACVIGVGAMAVWLGASSYITLLALWAVLGAATSIISTGTARVLRDHSTDADRDEVFTAQFSLSHAAFLVTYPLAGLGASTSGQVVCALALSALALLGLVGAAYSWRPATATRTANTRPANLRIHPRISLTMNRATATADER
ncbi:MULTISPECIES: MFS transporter [unclassified Gordonia (in: high G+C Gram-positive bacteria)]|uniref:MFS transporter n=1 Tax=unclassified Gordonia (in: high G+C Gram-positive bacteria) TaxID=2657482 RepID=UPI000B214807|nr:MULTISPECIES: MFS transporter [unclassified Gordonia (in: high G+C Gram-positive bacteria)]